MPITRSDRLYIAFHQGIVAFQHADDKSTNPYRDAIKDLNSNDADLRAEYGRCAVAWDHGYETEERFMLAQSDPS